MIIVLCTLRAGLSSGAQPAASAVSTANVQGAPKDQQEALTEVSPPDDGKALWLVFPSALVCIWLVSSLLNLDVS